MPLEASSCLSKPAYFLRLLTLKATRIEAAKDDVVQLDRKLAQPTPGKPQLHSLLDLREGFSKIFGVHARHRRDLGFDYS